MKISVVMATYNGEQYLIEQLQSLNSQTRQVDEVIICDDCSKDGTVEAIRKYIEENNLHESWHLSVNPINLGYANNFHEAGKNATGDYIFFADQDDIWENNKVEIMTDIMEKHPDCVLLSTDYEPYLSENTEKVPPKDVVDRMSDDGVLEKISLTQRSLYIAALGCCMCVKKSFYDSIEKYWFDGWAQDDRMWKLAQCVDGSYLLHKKLVKHRIHSNNASTYGKYYDKQKRIQHFEEMLKANEQMLSLCEDIGTSQKVKRILHKHIMMMQKRISMLKSRNIFISILLMPYLRFYERKKSYILEMYLAMKC